ncbi:MAG: EpsG family protein [Lachnospiraceae bacterium]|nr:EpsG family protein [Lachnospiraceae bacterium]
MKKLKSKKVAIVLSVIPILFITMFRKGIGTDYYNYMDILDGLKYNIPALYGWRKPEALFLVLCESIIKLGIDYQWLFIISAFVYCAIVFYVIYSLSQNASMSIFLLFGTTIYFASLNELRQHLGCALLLLAFKFMCEKKFKLFFLIVLVAGTIHVSCFLFAVVYLFYYIKIDPKKAIALVVVYVACLRIFINILYSIVGNTMYAVYLSREVEAVGIMGILIQVVIVTLVSLLYQDTPEYRMLYSIELVCLALTFLQNSVPLIYRAKWNFYYPIILLLPMAVKRIRDARLRLVVNIMIVLCFMVYSYITVVVNKGYGVYPYQWIFG